MDNLSDASLVEAFGDVSLTRNKINVEELISKVSSSKSGAINVFLGTTRDRFEDKVVKELEYECYEEMALLQMKEICLQVRKKWPNDVNHMVIQHKIGNCPIKEISVGIAVSAAHRVAAIEATHYAIDALKANVVIWKKEVYEEGDYIWKENEIQPSLR